VSVCVCTRAREMSSVQYKYITVLTRCLQSCEAVDQKTLPILCLHAPSMRAVVATMVCSLARVDSPHLYRLGCEDTQSERARARERARASESE